MQLHCISVRWRAAGLRPLGAPLLFVMRTNVVAHLAVGWPARASSVLRGVSSHVDFLFASGAAPRARGVRGVYVTLACT